MELDQAGEEGRRHQAAQRQVEDDAGEGARVQDLHRLRPVLVHVAGVELLAHRDREHVSNDVDIHRAITRLHHDGRLAGDRGMHPE